MTSEEETREMEKILYDAAVRNDVSTPCKLLQRDPLIFDRASSNCQAMNPLHVAAKFGSREFVRQVLRVSPDLCLDADRFGRIPLHLAVIKGRFPVLQELIHAQPLAARESIPGGGNVLHLCVKHRQLEALKFLVQTNKDPDFANQKDDKGMTILHLAICDNQTETIEYLLDNKKVEVNAKTANGSTAFDLFQEESNPEIAKILEGAKRGSDSVAVRIGEDLQQQTSSRLAEEGTGWLSKQKDSLMVVAILIATMAFQAGINPAGGVWQEDSKGSNVPAAGIASSPAGSDLPNGHGHTAGKAVMAYNDSGVYQAYVWFNTIAFISSLGTILLLISGLSFRNRFTLWALMVIMWCTVTAIALTFGYGTLMITPDKGGYYLSSALVLRSFVGLMSFLVLGNTVRVINRWLIRRFGVDLFKKCRSSSWLCCCLIVVVICGLVVFNLFNRF